MMERAEQAVGKGETEQTKGIMADEQCVLRGVDDDGQG
jgi:hypothetical protein